MPNSKLLLTRYVVTPPRRAICTAIVDTPSLELNVTWNGFRGQIF